MKYLIRNFRSCSNIPHNKVMLSRLSIHQVTACHEALPTSEEIKGLNVAGFEPVTNFFLRSKIYLVILRNFDNISNRKILTHRTK